jgi:nucleotide-binding universal stress UspA family protein
MLTLLIPVDGSAFTSRSVAYAIRRAATSSEPVTVHLLNVQTPVKGVNVKLFISQESLDAHYREQGLAILETPCRALEAAGMACEHHISVGDPGEITIAYARSTACDEIIMGNKGHGAIAGAVIGSVAQKVVQLSPVPVVLVK